MADDGEAGILPPPTNGERRRLESWTAQITEAARTGIPARGPGNPALCAVVTCANRKISYCACWGANELETLATAILATLISWELGAASAADFIDFYLPEGVSGAWQISGPEVYAWMASHGWVGAPPAEWGWSPNMEDGTPRDAPGNYEEEPAF